MARKSAAKASDRSGVEQLLEDIKKLLIYALAKDGSQDDVAAALGVNQSTISRMFPKAAAKARGRKKSAKGTKRGGKAVGRQAR